MNPKYSIGQIVVVFDNGRLRDVRVKEIIIRKTAEDCQYRYVFAEDIQAMSWLSSGWSGTLEERIYESKADFISRL